MNSWKLDDYEVIIECSESASLDEINQMRKQAQRLVDEAIRQKKKMVSFEVTKEFIDKEIVKAKNRLANLKEGKPDRKVFASDQAFEVYKKELIAMAAGYEKDIMELEDKIKVTYNYEDDLAFIN